MTQPIVIPDGFTRASLLAAVDREISLRAKVYPRWVEQKRMTLEKSLEEQAAMRAVRAVIAQLPVEPPVQGSMFR